MDPIRLLHIWLERETAVHVNGLELTATALVGHCTVLAHLTIVKGGPHPPCSLHVGETQEYDQMEMDVTLPCAILLISRTAGLLILTMLYSVCSRNIEFFFSHSVSSS